MRKMNLKAIAWLLILIFIISAFYLLSPKRTYHSCMPLIYNNGHMPLVELEIEKKHYLVGCDLGSLSTLTLNKCCFSQFEKKPRDPIHQYDVEGRCQVMPVYLVPSVKFGPITLKNLLTAEDGQELCEPLYVGVLGAAVPMKINLLFDFKGSSLWISNDVKKLAEEGYSLNKKILKPFYGKMKATKKTYRSMAF